MRCETCFPRASTAMKLQKHWRAGTQIKNSITEAHLQADKALLGNNSGFMGLGEFDLEGTARAQARPMAQCCSAARFLSCVQRGARCGRLQVWGNIGSSAALSGMWHLLEVVAVGTNERPAGI